MTQSFSVYPLEPIAFESVSNVTATNSVDLGTKRVFKGEEYVYVYNAGAEQISVGEFAVLSANSGYSVTVSSITGFDCAFGVCKHATITTGAYGWLITRGFTTVTNGMASTALALSDLIFPAAAGKAMVLAQTLTTALSQLTLFQGVAPYGYVVSACASGGTGGSQALAYVKCWG